MPSRHALSISLTPHLHDFVEAQVASGRFGSVSEVVRAGLRLLEREMEGPARNAAEASGDAPADPDPGSARPLGSA
jgi:antitoxin ParD1/3/4